MEGQDQGFENKEGNFEDKWSNRRGCNRRRKVVRMRKGFGDDQ